MRNGSSHIWKMVRPSPRRPSVRENKPATVSKTNAPLALDVQDLWFRYKDRDILKGVSLQVPQGELVALMGRNGSGKSTLLKNIVGLLEPMRGKVRAGGDGRERRSTNRYYKASGIRAAESGATAL